MRRCTHLGSAKPSQSRRPHRAPSAQPIEPPPSEEARSSIVGLPGMTRVDMVATGSASASVEQEEPEQAPAVLSSPPPVPSTKPAEPAFGKRLGRPK